MYWTQEMWQKAGTKEQRRRWAAEHPLAWILEFRPTILFPGKGYIPLEPYPFQQDFLNCRDSYRAINKPRQCGISTIAAAEVAWEFCNIPGAQIVIVSKDKDAAINFHTYVYQILRSAAKNDPNFPKLVKENERVTTNVKGAKITSLAAGAETGRSFSATHLIFDEMAFAQYADDIWQAASPTLSRTGGRATIISTPKGRANLFAQIFEKQDHMGFTVFNYGWWDVPDYNPYFKEMVAAGDNKKERQVWIDKAKTGKWYKINRPSKTDLAWRQEFEGAFDANVGTVFSTRNLEKVFCRNYLTQKDDPDGIITEWWTSERVPNHSYAHGGDLGRKNDPCEFFIYDITTVPARLVEYRHIEAGSAGWSDIQKCFQQMIDYWDSEGLHDGTGVGDNLTDELAGYSEPFFFTKTSKENMITLMQHAFDHSAVRIPKIPRVFSQHQRYTWDDKNIQQDTVMGNGLAILQFYDSSDVVVGYSPVSFVGAL